jgi:hypothetical protein
MSDYEFYRIQEFVAACRRQWPGAMIVLRPDSVSSDASALPEPDPASGVSEMSQDDFNNDIPTEEDLDRCYGSKYLSATDIGNRKIRTRICKIHVEQLQQQGGKPPRPKFVIQFTTLDKPMVLNATNKSTLVDSLGKTPAAWINAEVGIFAEATQFGGKPTKGLRLRVLNKPATPKPAPVTDVDPWDDPLPEFDTAAEAAE